MRSVLAVLRTASAATAGLAVVLAASGWLYVVQPTDPMNPPIADALPLDELSRRSAVPLLVFVAVWGTAALLLGALARFAHAERLTAALLLGVGVGLWGYLASGISILVVRQIPARDAFSAAAELKAVYLPAALAAIAGALLGRSRSGGRRAPLVLALFVAAAGFLDLFHVLLPDAGRGWLMGLAPDAAPPLASGLVAPIGLALVLGARALARRRRQAWQLTVGLLSASIVLHVQRGFAEGVVVAVLLLAALIARRQDFDRRSDPSAQPRVLARAVAAGAFLFAYGAVALWINRLVLDQPFSARLAFRETSSALLGLSLSGSSHLSGDFGRWFPLSMVVLALVSLTWVLLAWLAPWRYRHRQEERERELARSLVRIWGSDTLAPFALRSDKSYFFSEDRRAFLAYRVVGGVAIVSGDPIGPPDALEPLVASFVSYAHDRDWRVAVLGASESMLELYRGQKLHALYHGDEAVVDTAAFSLEGRAIRKVRQSVSRLETAGYTVRVTSPSEIDDALRADLERIARAWRGDQPERGFAMALDALFGLGDGDALFVIGVDADGRPAGFLHFALTPVGGALSLSSMPRLRSTPNGFNEWLVCETVAWAREHGYARVSLNFSPFAALLAPDAQLSGSQRVQRRALLALKGHFQLDNLLLFNRKFLPGWQRRFVVYENRRDLPRVSLAALAAEAYLPFTGRHE